MSGASYVVRGAQIYCDQGALIRFLDMPICHGSYICGKAQMDREDCEPGVNIVHFGVCKKKVEAGATGPACLCTPVPGPHWVNAHMRTLIHGVPALMSNSVLICFVGGIIKLIDDGIKVKINANDFIGRRDSIRYNEKENKLTVVLRSGEPPLYNIEQPHVYKPGEFVMVNGVPYIEKRLLEDQKARIDHRHKRNVQKGVAIGVAIGSIGRGGPVGRGGKVVKEAATSGTEAASAAGRAGNASRVVDAVGTSKLSRNITNTSELDPNMLKGLKNEGELAGGGRTGGNRPLMGSPNSYGTTSGGHTLVYDSNGLLIYDIDPNRVKMVVWDRAPDGVLYQRDVKLDGVVPAGLLGK